MKDVGDRQGCLLRSMHPSPLRSSKAKTTETLKASMVGMIDGRTPAFRETLSALDWLARLVALRQWGAGGMQDTKVLKKFDPGSRAPYVDQIQVHISCLARRNRRLMRSHRS